MEVIINAVYGKDFPFPTDCSETVFLKRMDASVRRRLELRPEDTVTINVANSEPQNDVLPPEELDDKQKKEL